MSREKFKTLTEQMYYVLLCLRHECCGTDIMSMTLEMTDGRVRIGPGTLYNLLEQFADAGMIRETGVEGRKRSYILTDGGEELLRNEYQRLIQQIKDYDAHR
ncbi:MAG: PadR family transcriptional regulator [Clostridiales bacterium]|nr:PadR family transcriptional regulator [Clostridiales bacterium]MDY4958993.1 PadR family transcriptional regulator [Lentihominibacter sp.]